MQEMTRILAFILLILPILGPVPAWADRLSEAMELVREKDWDGAGETAGPEATVARDIIEWHRLRAG